MSVSDHLKALPAPSRWWICTLLLLATTLNYMDRVALNQTSVRIQYALGLTNEDYGWLEGGFSFAFAVGTLFTGFLVDRVGVRWVYPAVVAGWSLAGFLTGFAPGYVALLSCRVMLGLFEAGNWPCGIRTVRQVMPPKERSLGNALFQSGTALGAVVTPYIVLACIHWADPDEPARFAHFALGGGTAVAATGPSPDAAWQTPFRVVGAVGIVWVILWLVTVRQRTLRAVAEPETSATRAAPFYKVFSDRRFWILLIVIIGVNTTWHTFRVWLPKFLQSERGYSEADMTFVTTLYYITADIGSWTVGLTVLGLATLGMRVHTARMITFVGCTVLAVASVAVPFLDRGPLLTIALLTVGFGGLGLFATYFALSQELSAKHQGKVTGTLGAVNAIYLGFVFPYQGALIDKFQTVKPVLATASIPAVIAAIAVLVFWPKSTLPLTAPPPTR